MRLHAAYTPCKYTVFQLGQHAIITISFNSCCSQCMCARQDIYTACVCVCNVGLLLRLALWAVLYAIKHNVSPRTKLVWLHVAEGRGNTTRWPTNDKRVNTLFTV